MACATHETIADLAFAEANEELLTPEHESAKAHTKVCDRCATAFNECRRIIAAARRFYALEPVVTTEACLDDNALAEYLDDAMTAEERTMAEAHLASCRRCLLQLVGLSEVRAAVDTGMDTIAYVIGIARRGLRILTHPSEGYIDHSPATVATLGDEACRICRWTQSIDDIELDITVEYTDREHATVTVRPVVHSVPPKSAYITLHADDTLVQSENLDDSGAFVLRDLDAGKYALELNLEDGMRVPVSLVLTQESGE